MSEIADHISPAIRDEARRRIVEGENRVLSPTEEAELKAWLAADARHKEAYESAGEVWGEIAELQELADLAVEREPSSVAGWLQSSARVLLDGAGTAIPRPVAALGAAAIAVIAFLLIVPLTDFGVQDATVHSTEIAEVREIELTDGTTVTLGAKSGLAIEFSPEERRVVLSEGEAFFSVAKDPARPFFVAAGDTVIRVIGTKFDVSHQPEKVRVSVLEGVVEVIKPEVDPSIETPSVVRILTAGQRVASLKAGDIQTTQEIARSLPGAWRQGRLIYEDAPLRDVINDVNRYSDTPVAFADDDLEDLRVTAAFRTDQADKLADALTAILPVRIDRSRKGVLILQHAGEDRPL